MLSGPIPSLNGSREAREGRNGNFEQVQHEDNILSIQVQYHLRLSTYISGRVRRLSPSPSPDRIAGHCPRFPGRGVQVDSDTQAAGAPIRQSHWHSNGVCEPRTGRSRATGNPPRRSIPRFKLSS